MRDFKNMKRQRGRNRSGGGNNSGGGGGGRPQQNANRAFESNGPDNVKIRGHAQHVFEKYQQLARDAFSSGDRVLAENYLQHADHYFRLLRTIQPHRPASEILGRDTVASGLDIDFEEEFETQPEDAGGSGSQDGGDGQQGFESRQDAGRYDRDNRQDRYDGPRNDQGRNDQNRNDQARNEAGRNDNGGWRDRQDNRADTSRPDTNRPDTNRQDGNRQDGNRFDRDRPDNRANFDRQDNRTGFDRPDRGYNDRPDRNRTYGDRPQDGAADRFEGRRDNRRFDNSRRDERGPRDGQPRFEPGSDGFAEGPQPSAPEAPDALPVAAAPPAPQPSPAEASPMLRSHDGEVSEAPAFLQPASGEGEEARPRARRRRAPRTFQPGEEGGEPQAAPPVEGE